MTKPKAKKAQPKPKAKAKPEPIAEEAMTYIYIGHRHSRRLPDGSSEFFLGGDELPNPTPAELAAFGDLIVTAEEFTAMASALAQKRRAKAAQIAAKKAKDVEAGIALEKQESEAAERAKVLKEIRAARQEGAVRL